MKDPLSYFEGLPDFPGKRPPKNRPDSPPPIDFDDPFDGVVFKEIVIDGIKKRFYTTGSVAQVLNRSPQTVRIWERKGWIPAPTYRTKKPSGGKLRNPNSKGYRLYSHEQVEVLIQALKVSHLWGQRTPEWANTRNWYTFINYIKEHWKR